MVCSGDVSSECTMNLKKRVFIIVVSCLAVFSAMVFLVSLPGQLSLALREDSDCSRMETIPWERRSVSTMREDYVKPTRIKLDFVEEGFLYQNCCGRPNETAFKFIEPPQYLDNSKSPCWYNSSGLLSCVPYFFVVGVFKCGTTDLFKRITRHPDVLMGQKEIHWFTKLRRFGYSFDWYINQFDPLARAIDADIKRKGRSDLVIGCTARVTIHGQVRELFKNPQSPAVPRVCVEAKSSANYSESVSSVWTPEMSVERLLLQPTPWLGETNKVYVVLLMFVFSTLS
ncbi:hypothetical protein C0Q70_04406 [Pomacea canaliculata]|uniref:Sulfotransferase domain-containing protein n=1 Tax=Pomacea canaliculata TaxID=400727 RepID=A0A2T7PVK1_POMCA|nr:hypothetical protein C0Q70_04406 [Pomacea canaliculata]